MILLANVVLSRFRFFSARTAAVLSVGNVGKTGRETDAAPAAVTFGVPPPRRVRVAAAPPPDSAIVISLADTCAPPAPLSRCLIIRRQPSYERTYELVVGAVSRGFANLVWSNKILGSRDSS